MEPENQDTAGLPLAEDTVEDMDSTPSSAELEVGTEDLDSAGTVVEEDAVGTEGDAESLFAEYDLDELVKTDPKLKALADKFQEWGRAQERDSTRDKLEHEKKIAREDAERKALEDQYNKAIQEAGAVFSPAMAKAFADVVQAGDIPEEAKQRGYTTESYFSALADSMFNGVRTRVALANADERAKMLSQRYPDWKASPEAVATWTRALQSRDPHAMDEAYLQAVDEASKAQYEAETNAKAADEKAKAEAEAARAKELKAVEDTRNSSTRPTRDVPVSGRRLTTPEDLQKMSSAEKARLLRSDPERFNQMVREAEQVEERRSQRARSA